MRPNLRSIRAILALAALAPSALAADWYVDAVGGSDANNGTSPSTAWKTITHAVFATPQVGAQTIHVAPGIYDSALGEAFPWSWRPSLSLVGDQGNAVTRVVGWTSTPVIQMESYNYSNGWTFPNDTLIAGLTFQGASTAFLLRSNWNAVSPTLRDLAITGMNSAGVKIETFAMPQQGGGYAHPVLERVTISSCAIGLSMNAGGGGAGTTATDCTFSGSTNSGILVSAGSTTNLTLERCRIENSASWGMGLFGGNYGNIHVSMHASTIVHNAGGIWGGTGALYFTTQTTATQCTIADNGSVGVRMDVAYPSWSAVYLKSTIIHGHADDLATGTSPSTINYCEIGDGEFAGTLGNFQADPLFVNAPAGDYHLLSASPCIDAGDPALALEADCSRADVGAHSFVHPQSQPYCTAKLNSCGALPSITAVGTPSASAASGYFVSASGAKALKPGLLLYSTSGPAATPFDGGILCLAAPVRRSTLLVDTTGSAGLCNGVLSLDMNAFTAGALGGNPAPGLRVPGTRVDCQFWGRDSVAGSLLSNALEYFICL